MEFADDMRIDEIAIAEVISQLGYRAATEPRRTLIILSSNDLVYNLRLLDEALFFRLTRKAIEFHDFPLTPIQEAIVARQKIFFEVVMTSDLPDLARRPQPAWTDCIRFAFGNSSKSPLQPQDISEFVHRLGLRNPVQRRFAALVLTCVSMYRRLVTVAVDKQTQTLKDLLLIITDTTMDNKWFETHDETLPLGYIDNISLQQWYYVAGHIQRWTYFWPSSPSTSPDLNLAGPTGDVSLPPAQSMDLDPVTAKPPMAGVKTQDVAVKPPSLNQLKAEYQTARNRYNKALTKGPSKVVIDLTTPDRDEPMER